MEDIIGGVSGPATSSTCRAVELRSWRVAGRLRRSPDRPSRYRIVRLVVDRRRWLLFMAMLGMLPEVAIAERPARRVAGMPLETMNFQDAEHVGAVGTGCTWKWGSDRTGRLSMADDRAGVRRNGTIVALKPAPDAKELFFTYDRWVGDGLRIVVRDTGKVVSRGRESSETVAWLDVVEDGRTRSYEGRLNCGS